MSFDLSEISRILANMIRFGTVIALDGDRVRVKFGDNLTPPIQWTTERADATATWSAPRIGSQVVVLAPGGDTAQAVVLGCLYQDQAPAPSLDPAETVTHYGDGTVVRYNTDTHRMETVIGGTSIVADTSSITLTAGGKSLKVSGAGVQIVGETVSDSDITAGTISLQKHKHLEQGDGAPTGPSMA